jgi:hypothetical protein
MSKADGVSLKGMMHGKPQDLDAYAESIYPRRFERVGQFFVAVSLLDANDDRCSLFRPEPMQRALVLSRLRVRSHLRAATPAPGGRSCPDRWIVSVVLSAAARRGAA